MMTMTMMMRRRVRMAGEEEDDGRQGAKNDHDKEQKMIMTRK